jgi:hypothetical protein
LKTFDMKSNLIGDDDRRERADHDRREFLDVMLHSAVLAEPHVDLASAEFVEGTSRMLDEMSR